MKISIIIPIYNVEKEISRCLKSVIEQSYDDIELILVNDASPDDSFLIAKKIIEQEDLRHDVIYIQHEINQGLSAARNSGLEEVTGDYVFFLDSDDAFSSSESLSEIINIAKKYHYPDIVIANYQYIQAGETSCKPLFLRYLEGSESVFSEFVYSRVYWSACGRLVKNSVIQGASLRFKKGIYSEDALWTYFLLKECQTGLIVPNVIYNYYDNSGSIMDNINEKHVEDMTTIASIIYEDYMLPTCTCPLETLIYLEGLRRLALQYMFKFGPKNQIFICQQISRLKKIEVPIFSTKNSRYIRQSLLLRMPEKYIYNYLLIKWREKS